MKTVKIYNEIIQEEDSSMTRENSERLTVVDFGGNQVNKPVQNGAEKWTKIGTVQTKILVNF